MVVGRLLKSDEAEICIYAEAELFLKLSIRSVMLIQGCRLEVDGNPTKKAETSAH